MLHDLDVWPGLMFASPAILSAVLIIVLHPLLVRYTLARPNGRSSHRQPTPQGGGIAVIGATTVVLAGMALLAPSSFTDPFRLAVVFASVIALAAVGVTDDIRPLPALPRLLMQAIAVAVVLAILPTSLRILPVLPWLVERALMFIALLWLVNLVNFMDGIDWMTVAEVVPVTAALAMFGLMGALPHDAMLVAFALCGAMIGFAPFNRPVARLFLGDVGSLPIGLLLGWLLVLLADGHLFAALLLPLYYVADSTVTLLRRFVKGEPLTQAHRSHFYQRALDGGFSVYQIVGRVFLANTALAGLGALTLLNGSLSVQVISLIAGGAIVGALLWTLENAKAAAHSRH
jgi:UDP-N-acetylmuramyl pentapeptide phosphotransferase/UDP-N-acetylglucosamine-1-phosphate transferase